MASPEFSVKDVGVSTTFEIKRTLKNFNKSFKNLMQTKGVQRPFVQREKMSFKIANRKFLAKRTKRNFGIVATLVK